MKRSKGVVILNEDACRLVYTPDVMRDLSHYVDFLAPPMTAAAVDGNLQVLSDVDVVFSGWGGPRLDQQFLDAVPKLNALFYGAGTLADLITDAVWRRMPPLTITTAISTNAVPVTEYTLATILFSLKHGWRFAREARSGGAVRSPDHCHTAPGCYGTTVGLISLGTIATRLLKLLASFDFNVLVYDPFLDERDASELGVTKVTLDKIFRQADVVSLHTPHLAETERMITGALLRSMKQGATFINTARAAVVCQEQLIEVAAQRPDLQFVLDVVEPEQPAPDSALRTLENVVLTPHIAGSMGNECRRMGRFMVEELERYVAGRPLQGALSMESFWHSSHRPPHAPESFKPIHRVEPGITILTKTRRPLPV